MTTSLRSLALFAAVSCATALGLLATAHAQAPANRRPLMVEEPTAAAVHSFHVKGNVWMLVGAGANVAMQVGDEGVMLVDTGRAGTGEALLAAIRQITPKPIRYIVNTSASPDHIGNNEAFAKLRGGATDGHGSGPTPAIIAHENVLIEMSRRSTNGDTAYPVAAWPTDAYISKGRQLFFNDEGIDIGYQPAAHSSGDSIVFFRRSDVLVVGDVFTTTRFPLADRVRGGSVLGILASLNRMIDITIPETVHGRFTEGGTYVIPGHGRLCDEDDVVEYRDMVVMIRDRVSDLVTKQHLTLDQAKARRPAIDFDERYGAPEWTTALFVEALFQELNGGRTR